MTHFYFRVLERLTQFFTYLAILIIPLVWVPLTVDAYELPKYTLLHVCTLLGLLTFLIRAIAAKSFAIRRTPLDLPLVALWLVALVASLASKDQWLSFVGEYGSLDISFFAVTSLLVLYFLCTQTISRLEQVYTALSLMLVSGAVSGLLVIRSSVFGAVKLGGVTLPATLPHASALLSGLFLVVILTLAMGILAERGGTVLRQALAWVAIILSFGALFLWGTMLLWIFLAAGIVLLLVVGLTYFSRVHSWWFSLNFGLLVVVLIFIFLGTPRIFGTPAVNELFLNNRTSWSVVTTGARSSAKHLLIGGGLGNFSYLFSQYRPPEFNLTPVWNLRFFQPTSSLLAWGAATGLAGVLALAVVILMVMGMTGAALFRHRSMAGAQAGFDGADEKSPSGRPMLLGTLGAGWLLLTAMFGVVNFGAAEWIMWFTITALMTVVIQGFGRLSSVTVVSLQAAPQYALVISFSFILLFAGLVVWGVYVGRFYAAEIVYFRNINQPPVERIASIQRAMALNPYRSGLAVALADAFLVQAQEIANRGGDPNQVYQTFGLAIAAANHARELSPHSPAIWEYTAALYANARALVADANQWVKSSLEQALALEPSNPRLYLLLSQAEELAGNMASAHEAAEKAVAAKPNFIEGYLRLAQLADKQKDSTLVITSLERGLPYASSNPDYLVEIGLAHFNRNRKDDWNRADQYFRQALFFNAGHSNALFALATLEEKRGNKTEARRLFEKVKELNPQNEGVERKLDSLRGGSGEGAGAL